VSTVPQLPEPLLTYALYEPLVAAHSTSSLTPSLLQASVTALPAPHQWVLLRLLALLSSVVEEASANRMSAPNLGIVFGPGLLRAPPHRTAEQQMADAEHVSGVVTQLIVHAELLKPALAVIGDWPEARK
jgi:hypothetical protein